MNDTPLEQGHSLFLPLLLVLITLLLWFGFQTFQLIEQRQNLQTLSTNQETIYGNAQKMRAQLDGLASGTSKLAQKGNPNAQQVVNALAQRGITINSNEASSSPPK